MPASSMPAKQHQALEILSKQLCFFGRADYSKGTIFGPRTQLGLQMFQMLRGSVEIEIDGNIKTVKSGECILLKPGRKEVFRFSPNEDCTHTWAYMELKAKEWDLNWEPYSEEPMTMPDHYRRIIDLGYQHKLEGVSNAQLSTLTLYLLEEHHIKKEKSKLNMTWAWKAERWVERQNHIVKDAQQVAKALHISLPHLNRSYRQERGSSLTQYLWSRRLQRAAEMLAHTNHSIEQIAESMDFQTTSHFCQRFKRMYDCTPLQYRER